MSALPTMPKEPSNTLQRAGSARISAEAWWTRHAELLAEKMKIGGVRLFKIELSERGTYEFEAAPLYPEFDNASGMARRKHEDYQETVAGQP